MAEENQNNENEEKKVPENTSDPAIQNQDQENNTPSVKPVEKPVEKVMAEKNPAEPVAEEPKGYSTPERQALVDLISTWSEALEFTEEATEFLTVTCKPAELHTLAEQLKNNEKTKFDYMFCLTGVDYPNHMLVVYHLKSTTLNHQIVVKVKIEDRENPAVDTLSDLWRTAELHEREVFDLFGIKFNNHPDLRRLFLTDDWVGYPMRKDYVDEVNIVSLS